MARFSRAFVSLNNFFSGLRRGKVSREELLLLFPVCLQNSLCDAKITSALSNCRRCGRCKVKSILEMVEHYGIEAAVATGGELALERARVKRVRAIVAIACERELRQGIQAIFPKRVMGIINLRPHGPCRDTDVELPEVERAIRQLLKNPPGPLQSELPRPPSKPKMSSQRTS